MLTAGASRRMGRPKALLELTGGETFLGRICWLAREAGAEELVAVAGPPHGEALAAAAPGLRWAWNDRPERGMLSSVQSGLLSFSPGLRGCLLWPVDTPLVALETVRLLLGDGLDRVRIPTYETRGGHPIWLPARLWADLLAFPPESPAGLRAWCARHDVARVPVPDEAVLLDIDTPADLSAARAQLLGVRDRQD